MKTFIISLNDINDTDIYKTLKLYNLYPQWFKAINGKEVTNPGNTFTDNYFNIATPNAIGCALSHLEIWKDIIKYGGDNENYLIIEDDVFLEDHNTFKENLDRSLENVPNDFDILYLGCFGCTEKYYIMNFFYSMIYKSTEFKKINNFINSPRNVITTHAYIINKKGCIKLIDLVTKYKIDKPIDEWLNYFFIYDKLNVYVSNPILMSQNSTRSYDGTNHPVLINKIMSIFYMENGQYRLDYILNNPILYNKNLNLSIKMISIIYLVLGIILSFSKISILTLSKLYFLLHLVDFYWVKNWNAIFIHYFIFIFPSLLKEKSEFIKI